MNKADTEYRKDIIPRTEVLRMAREAKQYAEYVTPQGMEWFDIYNERFAALVASAAQAKEREACAKIAETPIGEYEVVVACGTEPTPSRIPQYANWQDIAEAIRARVREKI